jgi:6-phosphogluconolactonase
MAVDPLIVILIGVSGSGKSTIGTRLARAMGCQFLEGDTLHSQDNIDKMSRGVALTDEDRRPWLSDIHTLIADAARQGVDLVVACSALKQEYRETLARGVVVTWVYLKGSQALFRGRLQQRTSHFMKADLLASQFDALEEPSNAIVIDASATPDAILDQLLQQLPSQGRLRVADGVDEISAQAAAAAVEIINRAVAAHGRCSVALSGGGTPRRFHRLLSSQFRAQVPWAQVHFFWGDERYVPLDHADSNYRMARETLLDHVPCPASNIHPMPTHLSPAPAAAAAYEQVLREHFGDGVGPAFDLNILGIGEDGHTASVFAGSPAVDEQERWVVEAHTDARPQSRLTLTLPAISRSTNIYVLVAGAAKAGPLRQALAADSDPRLHPAAGIRSANGTVVWWADSAAAQSMRLLS